jgi:hypothetical protein
MYTPSGLELDPVEWWKAFEKMKEVGIIRRGPGLNSSRVFSLNIVVEHTNIKPAVSRYE